MSRTEQINLPEIQDSRTVDLVDLKFGFDGIMYGYVTDDPEDQVYTQRLVNQAIGEMTNGQKVPLLLEYKGIILPTLEAREFWASEENSKFTLADAFVMKSLPMKLIGNFYLNFNKPSKPTRIFSNRKEAISWLKSFI